VSGMPCDSSVDMDDDRRDFDWRGERPGCQEDSRQNDND